MIEMQDVWKTYSNGSIALEGLHIQINKGDFVFIVGPSGAGKSTLIKLLYREERPTKGRIVVNHMDISRLKKRQIPRLRRSVGIVFQDYKLLSNLTVYENVGFALEVVGTSKRTIKKRVLEVLDRVRLKHKARVRPDQLSGGEQQRVSMARALVNKPEMIIADEPTGNLDPETSWDIMKLLEQINTQGTTVVMATHDRDIVNKMKKRVLAIENGRVIRDEERGVYGYD